jgi:hypothetical protein
MGDPEPAPWVPEPLTPPYGSTYMPLSSRGYRQHGRRATRSVSPKRVGGLATTRGTNDNGHWVRYRLKGVRNGQSNSRHDRSR